MIIIQLLICSMLISLPIIAAFIHSSRTNVQFLRSTFLNIQTNNESGDDNEYKSPRINKILRKLQTELLSDVSIQQTTRSNDRGLTLDQIVREAILSTRLPNLNLNRTRLGLSTLAGAGRGLFTTECIAKGDIITCYPGDALLYASPADDDDDEDEVEENDDDDEEEEEEWLDEEEEEWIDETVIWGSHMSIADRLDEDAVFDGISEFNSNGEIEITTPALADYAAAVCDTYSVMGMSTLDADPAYYGHFANDGAGHFASQKGDEDSEIEKFIATYVLESVELSNAMHRNLGGGLHMGTVATRDIEEGEEIFVTYGPDYWLEHS